LLAGIAWDRATIARFLGCWLSEPKPHVFFDPPKAPLSRRTFRARVAKRGVRLDLRTQLLYDAAHVFINGAAVRWPAAGAAPLRRLANARALAPDPGLSPEAGTILYNWYRDGYVHPGTV
jgi:50S ribosomal protein L16 3-hydroxylase